MAEKPPAVGWWFAHLPWFLVMVVCNPGLLGNLMALPDSERVSSSELVFGIRVVPPYVTVFGLAFGFYSWSSLKGRMR